MLDILYFLEAIIPNFGEMIETIGIIILFFGIADAFFGYKQFKIILAITGFLVGATAGLLLFFNSGNGIADSDFMRMYMLIGGIIGAALSEIFHKLGVFIVVGALGVMVFLLITQNTQVSLVLGAVCGIAGVCIEKYVIIVTTAFSGGSLTALGIWFIALANGDNVNVQAVGWLISICGLIFQLWLENRNPTEDMKDSLIGDVAEGIFDFVISIVSVVGKGLYHLIKDPKKTINSFIYKENSDELNSVPVFLSLGIPIAIGAVPGILFRSFILAMIIIVGLYAFWLVLYARKRKAEVLPGGYVPKLEWEKWLNRIMDSRVFLIFIFVMPFFPGFLAMMLAFAFTNNDVIAVLLFLASIVGSYIALFKFLDKLPPKEPVDSPAVEDGAAEPEAKEVKGDLELANEAKSGSDARAEANMTACSSCGKMINVNARFCNFCGKETAGRPQNEMVTCENCGKSIKADVKFCYYCGVKIGEGR